ncbi:MAG: glycosyltransferase family 2 protein [Methanobacterium sp.]
MNIPGVTIIIMNWNGWENIIECLQYLFQINYPNYDVIIVDNHSEDDSLSKIRQYCTELNFKSDFDHKCVELLEFTENEFKSAKNMEKGAYASYVNKKLVLIKNEDNYGFAEGNNRGIQFALHMFNPEYILLLNNDTIVDKNFLNELVNVAEHDENVGSVQSLLLKPGGKVIDSLGHEVLMWAGIDKEMNSEFKNDFYENVEIFGSCAAAALYRTHILKEVGFFDKDFFAVYEDLDLSWKIRLEGYKSILAVKSIVFHKRGLSKTLSEVRNFDLLKQPVQGYDISKNLMIMAIRYNPLSHLLNLKYLYKLFITSGGIIYFSLRTRKAQKTIKILIKNIKLRRNIQKNHLFKKIQKQWTVQKII